MRSLIHLLLGSSTLLGLSGCMSDFSPDPINTELRPSKGADGGSSKRDAGKDAAKPSTSDVGDDDDSDDEPVANADAGMTDEPDAGDMAMSDPGPTECNLTGKWLVTERFGLSGLGAQQAV
jgi:hypothetical protein